jgi:phosphoglycerate dehydrogenase-like enzyme
MSYVVACLDVYDSKVKEIILRNAPENWEVRMAISYDKAEQKNLIKEADFILAGWAPVPAWMLSSSSLKMVQKFGVGYEKIDILEAEKQGVGVAIAAGMNAVPVSELVVLMILSIYRNMLYLDKTIKSGLWVKSEVREKSYQIYGKKVGLIGFGSVGREVAKRLQSFEAKILYFDMYRLSKEEENRLEIEYSSLEELLKCSDIISLHVPLTKTTRGLISKKQLSMMKENVILINTARGDLIVEYDLIEALKKRNLLGAGLDVFEQEPIQADNPLLNLDNVILTPHIGGSVLDNVRRMAEHCFNNMKLFVEGEPLPAKNIIVEAKRSSMEKKR